MVPDPILPLLRAVVFIASAAPITAVDLKSSRIPDALSLGGLACLSLFDAFLEPDRLLQDCLAAALAFALFYGIRAFTMGLGFGDIKYAALVAFYAGIPYCFAAMAASALAALLAFAAVAAAGGRQRIVALPFAPFLTLGALAAAALEAAASGGRIGP